MLSGKRLVGFWVALLVPGMVFGTGKLRSLSVDSTWKRVEYVISTNAWLKSGHALGIKELPVSSLTNIELAGEKLWGNFINYYESNDGFLARAHVESYRRLNSNLTFYGKIGYEDFKGKNMGGSVFINPYQYPLGIEEFSDTTTGAKSLERYHLAGGVSAKITRRWTLGGKVNYQAANYAKLKDMRHTNKLLDLDAYLGAAFSVSDRLEVGLGYGYARRIESVKFKIYGNTDKQYLSLINFGSFYGFVELHDKNGYTGENDVTPVVNIVNHASLYANLRIGKEIQWFSEFNYGKRNGYYGKNGSDQIVYTEHSGEQYAYHGVALLNGHKLLQTVDFQLTFETVDNRENIYRRQTSSGGSSSIVYFGQSKVLDQQVIKAELEYTTQKKMINYTPKWILRAKGNYYGRQQTASIFPFFRKQEINQFSINILASRNRTHFRNLYSLDYGVTFAAGNGISKRDGLYVAPSESQKSPGVQDTFLNREYEYYTSPRIQNMLGMRYAHKLRSSDSIYLGISFTFTRAFNVHYLGENQSSAHFALGYSF